MITGWAMTEDFDLRQQPVIIPIGQLLIPICGVAIAFSGKAKSTRCKYCFCITHSSADCILAPDPQPMRPYNPQQRASPYLLQVE